MSAVTNGRVLHITPGKVNLPVVEDIADEKFMETAIFGTQYKQMLAYINSYVKYGITDVGVNPLNRHKGDSPNNVFTFVGERGSGKTSCMTSVLKLLTSFRLRNFSSYEHLVSAQFTTIDIIDPSYFDKRHNIVAIMVAKLYKAYMELDNSNEVSTCDREYRNDLIDAFIHTQRSMRCLLDQVDTNEYTTDDIENLSELSTAVDLRDDLNNLVQTYLKFIKKENGLLVLSIDDIDLNVSEADTMAEQIRKYLVSPHIIILLAAKLDQLSTIRNLHYAERYAPLLSEKHIDYGTIEEMTSQFLTKFAPHDQRVYMPTNEVFLNSGIEVNGERWYGDSVVQVVPELIFNRTRFLFYNSKQTPSFVIPRNLRKLCQLVSMLWSMATYHGKESEANKEAFKNYLFGAWLQDNLMQADRQRVYRLLDGWKNEQLNKIALDVLYEKYKNWVEALLAKDADYFDNNTQKVEVKALFDERNREYNLSVGDIMSLIETLEISFETHFDKCFFFIMRSIYSMALYEAYDRLTEKKDAMEDNAQQIDEVENNDNQALLYDPFDDEDVCTYHKLTGGRFYNYRLSPVMAREKVSAKYISRSDRMINYVALDRQIKDAVDLWKSYLSDKDGFLEENVQRLKVQVRLCEFFMLCCIRDINLRNSKEVFDYYDENFRQSSRAYYIGDYYSINWLFFDLGAFFFNITQMDECYQRYKENGKALYDLCLADSDQISLYATFRTKALVYRQLYTNPHAWQSWASIRNAEILSDLGRQFRSKCVLNKAENQKQLARYFKILSEYSIKTYDRDKKGTKLIINFEFASDISALLSDNRSSELFNEVYSNFETDAEKDETNSVVQIDVDKLLTGRYKKSNLRSTIKDYLLQNEGLGVKDFKFFVDTALANYGEHLTKEEIRTVGNNINLLLYKKYGSSKKRTENSV